MTLLNLIVHPDVAYLATDSGYYGDGGTVTRLDDKYIPIPSLKMVVATAGQITVSALARAMLETGYYRRLEGGLGVGAKTSQADFIATLPHLASRAMRHHPGGQGGIVVFAGYSDQAGSAFGGNFAIVPNRCGKTQLKDLFLNPGHPTIDDDALRNPEFDPLLDLMPIVDQQRLINFGTPEEPICGITGDINVVTVSALGLGGMKVHTYPATVGEKVPLEDASWPPDDWSLRRVATALVGWRSIYSSEPDGGSIGCG